MTKRLVTRLNVSNATFSILFRMIFATFLILSRQVTARSWNDIASYQQIRFEDTGGKRYLRMEEQQYEVNTFSGSDGVNSDINADSQPVVPASINLPSSAPTNAPDSMKPLSSPSSKPILTPTSFPTISPTVYIDQFAPAIVPSHPDMFYFNYDNSTFAQYGPGQLGLIERQGMFHVGIQNNQWGKAKSPPNMYWQEFSSDGWGPWKGSFDNSVFLNNLCMQGQFQSPIDLRSNAVCNASHQIRPLRGNFKLRSSSVTKKILSNKLRLEYRRRPCADMTNSMCKEPDPPHGDFPNGFSGFSDVMHIDVKVPSEHMLEGVRFDAEMQIFHYHPGRKRFPVQSVLIRAIDDEISPGTNNTSFNAYFQSLLNQFQFVYNVNAFRCGIIRKNKKRRLTSLVNRNLTELINFGRKLNSVAVPSIWDPYHITLVPTIWFYRYDGSLTEPPCSEVVSWFVADQPMIISNIQLQQLKLILFTNVDLDCRKTSVHNLQSVARPVRQSNNRSVSHCTASNFVRDVV
jgi:carbonic anhydrase